MPPNAKFTRQEILEAALSIVRVRGMEGLTARALGEVLGTSARPIFTAFASMEEVEAEVLRAADEVYQSWLEREMARGIYPPYKASGMGYIGFAKQERELFKLLFMRDRSREEIEEGREKLRPILALIREQTGLSEERAYRFHIEMWIYVHGIATMLVTRYLDWDMETVSEVLTDAYGGLKMHYCGEERDDAGDRNG